MKKLIFIILTAFNSFAQNSYRLDTWTFLNLSDSLFYKIDKLDLVAKKIGLNEIKDTTITCKQALEGIYNRKYFNKQAGFGYLYFNQKIPVKYLKSNINDFFKDKITGDTVNICGIKILSANSRKTIHNEYQLIYNAYMQECNKNDSQKYYYLPEKSRKEMLKRNWIDMGLGIHYMHKDNPFMSSNIFLESCYTGINATYLGCMILGPILAKSQKDKLFWGAIGLVGTLEFRLLAGNALKKEYLKYENIRKSGYRIPDEIKQ